MRGSRLCLWYRKEQEQLLVLKEVTMDLGTGRFRWWPWNEKECDRVFVSAHWSTLVGVMSAGVSCVPQGCHNGKVKAL